MRGHLRQLDEEGTRSQAVVYVRGTRADGKRHEQRVVRVFRGTKREAQQQLAQLLVEVGAGRKLPPTRRTLSEALGEVIDSYSAAGSPGGEEAGRKMMQSQRHSGRARVADQASHIYRLFLPVLEVRASSAGPRAIPRAAAAESPVAP